MRRRSNTRRTREVELGESDQAENATGENENRNLDGGDESSPAKQGRLSMDDESSSLLQDANLQEAAPRLRTSRAIARPIAWVAAALSTMALIVAIVVAGVLLYRQSVAPSASTCDQRGFEARWSSLPSELKDAAEAFSFPVAGAPEEVSKLATVALLAYFNFSMADAIDFADTAGHLAVPCAMCHWMAALALGPYLNLVPSPEGTQASFWGQSTLQKASERAVKAAEAVELGDGDAVEHMLVLAMSMRFASGESHGERRDRDEEEFRRFLLEATKLEGGGPRAASLLVVAAQSLLLPVSWDYFEVQGDTATAHRLHENSARALELLHQALEWSPDHPGALHFLIHVWEMAGDPEGRAAGVPFADTVASRRGFGLGHLQHMPSHTYLRVGRYSDAVDVNIAAHRTDMETAAGCRLPYAPEHNLNMLVYASSMAGWLSTALEYLERKERVAALFSAGASVGADCVTRPQLYARYALWSHVESLPEPGQGCRGAMSSHGGQGISEVAVRYARALAAASRARDPTRRAEDRDNALATAVSERRRLEEAASAMPPDRQTVPGQGLGIYSAKNGDIAAVLGGVAEAAVLLAEGGDGALEAAERALRAAVAIEDAMGYFEPPSMHQPARQCLGAVLLARGAWEGAEEVFGEDLATFPENAWSLMGMALAKEGLGEGDAGALLRERAAVAWRGESVGAVLSPCPCLGP